MIKGVGIELAGTGEHNVRCLDEGAPLCDRFSFQTTPEGLTKLEKRIQILQCKWSPRMAWSRVQNQWMFRRFEQAPPQDF
jgi:hypothetical protein